MTTLNKIKVNERFTQEECTDTEKFGAISTLENDANGEGR